MTAPQKQYVPSVTVITKADLDAQADAARRLVLDPRDHYPPNPRWPADPAVFAPPIAIDCDELERRQCGDE